MDVTATTGAKETLRLISNSSLMSCQNRLSEKTNDSSCGNKLAELMMWCEFPLLTLQMGGGALIGLI